MPPWAVALGGIIAAGHSPANKKGGREGHPFESDLWMIRSGCRRRRFVDFGRLDRAGILALGLNVTVDEFDHGLRSVVAVAKARLHDAGIATVALLVARADDIKEFLDLGHIADFRNRLAAGMEPAPPCARHELLHDRPQLFRLRQRRDDLLVLDQ